MPCLPVLYGSLATTGGAGAFLNLKKQLTPAAAWQYSPQSAAPLLEGNGSFHAWALAGGGALRVRQASEGKR